ncbi:MAG TPA: tail fiber protein, partial [Anaerolineales bacterium]|nr:tail fiber protein [Anaerolineales bacterium]
ALCNGQLLPINQNQALFSLLGTTYGGDGRVNFALPNLQGRIPLHSGNGHTLGEVGGQENHTLIAPEMAEHIHTFSASNAAPNQGLPTGNMWANNSGAYSSASPDSSMNPASISSAGGNQPHTNVQPYLVLNFIIALQGIFPSQN